MRKKTTKYYLYIKKHISTIAFGVGFIIDTLTLTRIDLLYENFVFISYLLIAYFGILLMHSVDTRRYAPKFLLKMRTWLPVMIQFPLGGLFSGFLIFYTKSASLFVSWPFLLILLALFVGNEFFKKRYERLVFQISLFYFALFSYLVLIVPILLKKIGTSTFVFSGILSLFIITLLLQPIIKLFPKLYAKGAHLIRIIIAIMFIGFNVLYFTNTIPPVPLALKEIGVYHSVVHASDGDYEVSYEKPAWYEGWRETSGVYHRLPNEAAYCFSSVFLPTSFHEPIYHSWQKKASDGTWLRVAGGRISFTATGGRSGGYRGYTFKRNLSEGEWRCVVETQNGQTIGEVRFNIIDVDLPIVLTKGVM